MREVITLVLGGGRGTRLFPLTKYRSKPAVPLAGKYRLIDIPLSNCVNSGLNRVYVLTQFLSVSLHRHIRQTYRFDSFSGGFVEILAAQQTMEAGADWYQGTADAVRKNVRYLEPREIKYVLILSGDQLYRMNYGTMLRTHIDSRADVTIAAMPVDSQSAGSLGIMRLDDTGRVTGFCEKPQTEEQIHSVRMDPEWINAQGIDSRGRDCLASMGIYIFNRDVLLDLLLKTTYQDFGREVFPATIQTGHVQTYLFDGYWEDIGTIRAFYEANLALAGADPPFDLAKPESLIYSRARFLPPSRFGGVSVSDSLIADGCSIGPGTTIENSVIGLRCVVGRNVTIRNSVLMGADDYETREDLKLDQTSGCPVVGIGDDTVIQGAIVDKNCRIGRGVVIANPGDIESTDDEGDCIIRDRIPVVVKGATLGDGWRFSA